MNTMDWSKYKGKFVSILMIGKDDKTENYLGRIKDVTDDGYLSLDTKDNGVIVEIIFKVNLIKSVWIYPKEPKKGRYISYDII